MLIACPKCNTKVSDKAQTCPHCCLQIGTLIECPDCGKLAPRGTVACPGCGYPLSAASTLSKDPAALVTCHECGGQVSDNVQSCPRCGAPVGSMSGSAMTTVPASTDMNTVVTTNQTEPTMTSQTASGFVSATAAESHSPHANSVARGTKHVWYYAIQHIVYGPTSANDIYGRILEGRLAPNVSVWTQGASDWAPAADYVMFGKEGPDVTDVLREDSLLESDTLPPMVSLDSRIKYAFASDLDSSPLIAHSGVVAPKESIGSLFLKLICGFALLSALLFPFGYFAGRVGLIGGLVLLVAAAFVFSWTVLQLSGLARALFSVFSRGR
jgi:hypothetical protein